MYTGFAVRPAVIYHMLWMDPGWWNADARDNRVLSTGQYLDKTLNEQDMINLLFDCPTMVLCLQLWPRSRLSAGWLWTISRFDTQKRVTDLLSSHLLLSPPSTWMWSFSLLHVGFCYFSGLPCQNKMILLV